MAFIDTATGRRQVTVHLAPPARPDDLGTLPYAVVLFGRKLYVSEWNGGGVSVIEVGGGSVLRRIPTGGHASGSRCRPTAVASTRPTPSATP